MEVVLCEQLLARDEQALAEIYDRFANIVYGIALRVTGDRAHAEDITQETFTYLWNRPTAFDPERGSLRVWLSTVAHRRAVDVVRKMESQRKRTERLASEMLVSSRIAVDELRFDHAEIENALAELPEYQAAAIRLAYFEGRTYCEVAELLHIPEGTAKSRIRLGLRRLSTTLGTDANSEAS